MTRKTKQVYQIAFSYKGVQCRETLDLPHTKANETYCARLRAEILGKISKNEFTYTDYFPESARAELFSLHTSAKKKNLKDLLEDYRDRTKKTLEHSTWASNRKDIDNILIPWVKDMAVADLTPAEIRTWVASRTCSLKRLRNLLLPLRAVFDELKADGLLVSGPFDNIDLKRQVSPAQRVSDYEPNPYSVDELRLVLGNCPEPVRWLFQLHAFTGLRTSELIALTWEDFDLVANTLRVSKVTTNNQDKPRTKTPSGARVVPLLPAALEAIEAMKPHTLAKGGRFGLNPKGRRKDPYFDDQALWHAWTDSHEGTGVPVRNPYVLRHSFASHLLSQGENIAYIARLLGHKNTEMVTRTYGRWIAEGEKLGFDRPPRRYGMVPLWSVTQEEVCKPES